MKTNTLIILIACFTVISFIKNPEDRPQAYVYLCKSTGGKKYHYEKGCRGLSNCEHEIIKVTFEEAKKRGKTLCGYEN